MELQYTVILIILFLASELIQYYRVRKMASRKLDGLTMLIHNQSKLSWKLFVFPALLIFIGLLPKFNLLLMITGLLFAISNITSHYLHKKYKYAVFYICNSNLIRNDFNEKIFDLAKLKTIRFKPLFDSFILDFSSYTSLSIPYSQFSSKEIVLFLKEVRSVSKSNIEISEDAINKIV